MGVSGHGCERNFSVGRRMKMKRKKWSEQEELTLLSKYSDLLTSGALAKLKTREKKFKPIADHVNSEFHLQDPLLFPFRWTWRDVSIKVQNMRHQYLGVKQKIKLSDEDFDWKDGENHWQNFLKYKEVFGDVPLDAKVKKIYGCGIGGFGGCGDLGFGIESEGFEEEEEEDEGEEGNDVNGEEEEGEEEGEEEDADDEGGEEEEDGSGEMRFSRSRKMKKGLNVSKKLRLVGMKLSELTDTMMKREEERREMDFRREKCEIEKEMKRKEAELRKEKRMNEKEQRVENREVELEKRELMWARREFETRLRFEQELGEERRKRMKMEEKREEEEMEWRGRMIELQIEHEKQMMQMHGEACQNQMQILGVMARLFCQFFGSSNDGMGALHSQVLQNLQDPGGLDDSEKPDANSPSEFL